MSLILHMKPNLTYPCYLLLPADESSMLSGNSDSEVDYSSDGDDSEEEDSKDGEVDPALTAQQIFTMLENKVVLHIGGSIAPHFFAAIDRFCAALQGK